MKMMVKNIFKRIVEVNTKSTILPVLALAVTLFTATSQASESLFVNPAEVASMGPENFQKMIDSLRASGQKRLIIREQPKAWTGLSDAQYHSNFIYLAGLKPTGADEKIRWGDVQDLYPIFKYLSGLNVRVEINLFATISDLKMALRSTTPTAIVWTSHGNKQGFYDAEQALVPYSIFSGASKSVFQFINGACYGRIAMDEKYNIPAHIKNWGWSDLVYHPGYLKDFMISDKWSIWINHPGFVRHGVSCKSSGEGQRVFLNKENEGPTEFSTLTLNACYKTLAESKNGFICIEVADKKYDTFSMKLMQGSGANTYSEYSDCLNRLGTAMDGKICRRYSDNKILSSFFLSGLLTQRFSGDFSFDLPG